MSTPTDEKITATTIDEQETAATEKDTERLGTPAGSGEETAARTRTRLSERNVSLKAMLLTGAGLALAGLIAALVWMLVDKSAEIDDMHAAAADRAHAEQVALDYATGAADMSYQDTAGWLERLTANTTPELSTRLRNAAGEMEQLLKPLQWTATPSPITAKVTSVDGNVFEVDAFVQIVTRNVQTPADGIDTTATYRITIDKGQDWKITAITSNGTNMNADGASAAAPEQLPGAPAGENTQPAPTPGN